MVVKKKLNIIILGASSSIGSFLAKKFYDDGHHISLFYKSKNNFLSSDQNNKSDERLVIVENFNFKNKKKISQKINYHKKLFKKSDIIINAIGEQGEINNFFKLDKKRFNITFDINFFSFVYFFQKIYSYIKDKKNLLIILFSGGGTTSFRRNFSPYSLSKTALVKLVEIISREINNKNVRINAISPGIIDSKMTKIILKEKKMVDKKEINKIKKEIKKTSQSLSKIFSLIDFLYDKNGKNITGKMISSRWDRFNNWDKKMINKIEKSEIYNLRRVLKK